MLKFTANYTNTHRNFVIQNLDKRQVNNVYLPAVCVLQNILQRGTPTLMSAFLISKLGAIHKEESFKYHYRLISAETPKWNNRIKGDDINRDYPARTFFEKIIPEYLPEYSYIQQLILPEAEISEITNADAGLGKISQEYKSRSVDFYLPQARLVIEIDGHQHANPTNKAIDDERDKYLKDLDIITIRINTVDIKNRSKLLTTKISEIKRQLFKHESELNFYKDNITNLSKVKKDVVEKKLLPTAIIRFQLTILKLVEYGQLKLDSDWTIYVRNHDINGYEELAINDLYIWLKNLLILQQIELPENKRTIKKVLNFDDITGNNAVKIDFSLLRRWTDENEANTSIVFVRTDYFIGYPRWTEKIVNGQRKKELIRDQVNYFVVNTLPKPIEYKLDEEFLEGRLEFFLRNIFGYEKFNEGQAKIIAYALNGHHTIGLLPTSSGKSLCYQMAALLQPSISFVVSPLKSLMRDQVTDLKGSTYIDRVGFISSDQGSAERDLEQKKFSQGRYLFIFISPERFQTKKFREYFGKVCSENSMAYAVIDEVHCLSEWGHDFRLSYLNLADTIREQVKSIVFIGLTATASEYVLKDIQSELDIKDDGVKTKNDFTRPNLEFTVIDDMGKKEEHLIKDLKRMKSESSIFENLGEKTKCGIIFTPYAEKTQILLVSKLNRELGFGQADEWRVRRYNSSKDGMTDEDRKETQDDFKENKFPLLVATKAFGMGINKLNIRYTIHYGIPASMEALYQEAGRAGRDNKSAVNHVLISREMASKEELKKIWERKTSYEDIEEIQYTAHTEKRDKDVYKQLLLWLKSNSKIEDEVELMLKVYKVINKSTEGLVQIKTANYTSIEDRGRVERAIYKLKILGVLKDWLVEDFVKGVFYIKKAYYNDQKLDDSLLLYIHKYNNNFTFNESEYYGLEKNPVMSLIEKRIRILLHWSYDNFSYNRRQSLKGIYELSCKFVDREINAKTFKQRLEKYFARNEETSVFEQIVDDQKLDIKLWFNLFYVNGALSSNARLIDIQSSLTRFLESYRDNIGLNLISGLVRLALNDYENTDGRIRLEDALSKIVANHPEIKEAAMDELCKIAMMLKNKELLVESMCKYYCSRGDYLKLYDELNSSIALQHYLYSINSQLIEVNSKIYGKLKHK